MQIEEGQFAPMRKRDNFAIEDKIEIELARLLSKFRKLIGDSLQIARENLHPLRIAVQLRPNAVELIFDENCSGRRLGGRTFSIDKSFPNRFRGRLGTCQHAFDRPKDRQLRAMQFAAQSERRGRADVAQKHVCSFHIVERNVEGFGDCLLHEAFAQPDP